MCMFVPAPHIQMIRIGIQKILAYHCRDVVQSNKSESDASAWSDGVGRREIVRGSRGCRIAL